MGATELAASGWRSAWPSGRYRRGLAVGLVALVAAGAVVAASDATFTGRSDESASAPGTTTAEITPADSSATGGDEARLSAGQAATAVSIVPAAVEGTTPRVVRRAQLDIEVAGNSLAVAFDRVSGVADRLGGFVVSSSTSGLETGDAGPGDGAVAPARAQLSLRVPTESFDAARADLAAIGEIRSVRVSGEDVTAQLVDLGARLRALRAEEEALTTLLASATNVGEVLSVREQLSSTRTEIEQLSAQQDSLDDQATFATLAVTLSEPGGGPVTTPAEPAGVLSRSFERGLDGALSVVGGTMIVVGYLLPILALVILASGARRLTGWFGPRHRAA